MPSNNGRGRRKKRAEAAKRVVGCEPQAPSRNVHYHSRRGYYWNIAKRSKYSLS
jgi:hypothetical protein